MAAMVTLAIAGCGGGSGATSSTTAVSSSAASSAPTTTPATGANQSNSGGESSKPLSKSQLIARADAICAGLNAQLAAARDSVSSSEDIVSIALRRAAVERAALAELIKLRPPASFARDWRRIIDARNSIIEALGRVGAYAAAGNTKGERAVLATGTSMENKLEAAAVRHGFKSCGQVG